MFRKSRKQSMALHNPPTTTEMQVTSIRFERKLIDKLKALAGNQGYQSLVREVLWDYVRQQAEEPNFPIDRQQIRAIMPAEAQRQEKCMLTGNVIQPHEEMWMAYTVNSQLFPLSEAGISLLEKSATSTPKPDS